MNCKQGDIAAYFGEDISLWGARVICVRRIALAEAIVGEPVWEVDPPLPRSDRLGDALGVFDRSLRPIPDERAEDETLAWAGKPADLKTEVPA